jgi:glycosyl transferase family 25
MIFDRYDTVRIVSLPSRKDRRRAMVRELRAIGQADNPRVSFFDAVQRPDRGVFRSAGSHGCFHSHLAILEEAAAAGQSVLILQDDCEFLPSIRNDVLPPDCDIFYGGYLASNPDDPHASDIIGAHCMGFSARAAGEASTYLKKLLDPAFPPDPQAAAQPGFNPAMRPPIDGACVWFRRAHPHLTTVFHLVANQRPSRSDISTPRFFDRLWGLRSLADMARSIKRRFPHADAVRRANASFVAPQVHSANSKSAAPAPQ